MSKVRRPPLPAPTGIAVVAAPAALVLTVALAVPAEVLWRNAAEFPAARQLTALLLAVAIAAAGLLALGLRLLPAGWRGVGVLGLTVLAALSWAQATFLGSDLGSMDGAPRQWSTGLAVISTMIWVAVPVLAHAFRAPLLRRAAAISLSLLVVQGAGVLGTAREHPAAFAAPPPRYEYERAFTFSRERNVIVLVLDSARRELFDEALADPKARDMLEGFTDYVDTLGGYPTTYASVPLILTGEYYENRESLADFVDRVAPASLPARLRELGYAAEIYPMAPLPPSPALADNLVLARIEPRAVLRLGLVSTLRVLPSVLRAALFDHTDTFRALENAAAWRGGAAWRSDIEFSEAFRERLRVVPGTPTFKYYHLQGMHLPYAVDERLEPVPPVTPSLEGARGAARGMLLLVERLLGALEEAGIYDDTMIVIAADHGAPWLPEELVANDDGPAVATSGLPISMATPLLLVKPFHRRGALETSELAATLADIAPTVLASVGDHGRAGSGRSLAAPREASRERWFHYYDWDDGWHRSSLPPIIRYIVSGPAREPRSWRAAGLVLEPRRMSRRRYQWGEVIDARAGGALEAYARWGLGEPEPGGTWTSYYSARMAFPVEPTRDALEVALDVLPFTGPGVDEQELILTVGDQPAGRWLLAGPRRLVAHVPAGVSASELRLGLQLPRAAAPAELGVGPDRRLLGVLISSLRVGRLRLPKLGRRMALGPGKPAVAYLSEGWHAPEDGYAWSGSRARLSIPVPATSTDLELDLALSTPRERAGQRVVASSGGERLYDDTIERETTVTLRLPRHALASGFVELELEVPLAVSPAAVTESADARLLGVALHALALRAARPAELGAAPR